MGPLPIYPNKRTEIKGLFARGEIQPDKIRVLWQPTVMFTLSNFSLLFFVHTSILGRISVMG